MSSPDVVKRLEQSFSALQQYFSPSRKQEGTGNPAQLVLFAEHAAKNGCGYIASESLELYHTLDPPVNQFLIRAHLCKAMLIADIENTGANLPEVKLGQALDLIVKAVSIASKSECYYFLIYNASVLLWQICRPFQRPEFRRLFARPLRAVVKALDEHVQQEYTWKLELYKNLILSQLDAGLKEEACRTCTPAIVLANRHVPDKLVDLVRLQASHNLGDPKLVNKETRQSPPVMFLLKLNKIRYAINYNGLCGTDLEQKLYKLFKTGYKVVRSARKSESYPLGESHSSIFLEAAMICFENSLFDLMQDCLYQLPRSYVQGTNTKNYLHQQLLQTQLMVARECDPDTIYTKKSMDTRLDAISELEEILKSTLRLSDPDLIEHVCVALWNISLPMLQHNLRHLLAKPLTLLASALEDISSLLYGMRLTVHLELAKISAQSHLLQAALDHLDKAMVLDINEKYTEQIKHHMHKFSLRAKIYVEPDSNVDKAAKMIQQCEDLVNKGSIDELTPLLVKVGKTLAPNFFSLALDGSPMPGGPIIHSNSDLDTNPDSQDSEEIDTLDSAIREALTEKGEKLQQYQMVSRHVKRFLADQPGSVDINQWCQLWGTLAKIARKNGVWDVARTAATFCLEYNEKDSVKSNQSKSTVTERFSSPLLSQRMSSASSKGDRTNSSQTRQLQLAAEPSHADESRHREDLCLLRTVAEVHCLLAECFIYQLQQENLSPGQKPSISAIGAEQSPSVMYVENWLSYVEWASSLSKAASEHFLKASKIGVFLEESHLVNNAAVYLWNYNQHLIQSNTLVELIPTFRSLLASMRDKFTKRNTDKELVVRTCTLLTHGIVKKWMPVHNPNTPLPSARGRSGKKSAKKEGHSGKKKAVGDGMQVDPEALPELKEAVEVCDYGLSVGGGISMSVRKQLLAVWVQCKQLLHQPITPGSYDITELNDGCTKECRALVAMEMLSKQGSKIWEFPNPPSLQAVFSLLCDCAWIDYLLELEIWTILAQLALESMNYDLVIQCTAKAVTVQHKNNSRSIASVTASLITLLQHPRNQSSAKANSDIKLESELMSLTYSFQGQALLASSGPGENISVVRRALEAFLDSARFGYDAGNYEFVISASSRYWNCSLSLSKDPMEHILLRDPLSELLNMIAPLLPHRHNKKYTSEKKDLLVSMYGMVFQAYIDKDSWEDGLKAAERAFSVMPKFLHRYLVHYKLIFKSRLGRSVENDMIKVQDESELILSSLWHTAALNAKLYPDKLQAYQQCIQVLKPGSYPWIRTSYLLELGEWLYQQSQFPVQDALDQFQLVVNTLLSLREKPAPIDDSEGGEGGDRVGWEGIDGEGEGAGDKLGGGGGTEEGRHIIAPSHLVVPLPSTICNVAQLDTLLRIHVMMSQLHGIGSQEHWDLSVAALAYCSLIWKLVYGSFAEGTKPGQHPSLPTATKDWAEFQVPDQILEYLRESEDIGSINRMTIKKPVLTLYYLDILVQSLLRLGLHPLTLPVLNLELVIAVTTLSDTTAITKLLHMRIASICLELDVLSALPIHNEVSVLVPDDQASSHVEMALFQAKKEALDREESRRTLIALKSTKSAKNVTFAAESLSSPQISYQAYCVGEDILVREVWARQAHLLIQQGQYSTARQLLDSARMESERFDDHHTLFLVHINSGLLAMAEKDTHLAVLSFAKALSLHCQLESLLEGVLHLSKAILESDDYRSQHVQILEHILNLVKKIGKKHGNTSPILNRAIQLLQSRVSVYSLAGLVEGPLTTHAKDKIHQLCTAIDDSTDLLLKWGLYREASTLLQLAGGNCIRIAMRLHSMEHQHYILKSLSLYRKALQSSQKCYMKVISVCHSLKEVMLPVETELVSAQMDVAEVLLLIFTEDSTETKNAKKVNQDKSSIQKVIDDYVRESVLPLVENEWLSEATVACDRVLNLLTSVYSMAKNNRKLKAKCTYLIGQCFSVMSENANPDPSQQWEELPVVGQKAESSDGDSLQEQNSLLLHNYSTVSVVVRQHEASTAEIEESTSLKFMYHTMHGLSEAIAMAVTSEQWELGMTAVLRLVDCIGVLDPCLSSQYLAFYQSLSFSVEMLHFLQKLQSSPDTSTLGALLCQREKLAAHTSYESPVMETNNTLLSSFVAFKSLSVSTNHLELLRSFPPYFRFVLLQHSPDMTKLYAAYLIPPQPPPPSAHKKAQQPTEIDPLEPAVSSVQVSPNDLNSMEELMAEYQEAVHQSMCSPVALDSENVESILTDVSVALECYLAKVLKPISIALSKENSSRELSVVILADTHLLSLPLETLPLFHKDNICSVSRDFSLQMLQHKIPKGSRETSGKTSEMKKREKHANLPPSSLPAAINGFKYIFDPSNSMMDGEDNNHSSKILAQIHSFPKLTGKWTGFNSIDNSMGLSEWLPLLKESSGLIFFGTEKFLSHLPPNILVSLNLPGCSFAMIMDSMSTPHSAGRQKNKSNEQLYYESPVQMAMLLRMTGVSSMVINQWHTSVENNVTRTNAMIKELLTENKTVGKVHWLTKTKEKDTSSQESIFAENSITYNCVLYGLPHLTLQ